MKKLLILILACLICLIPASVLGLTDVEIGISKNTGDNAVNTTYDTDSDGDLTDESWWNSFTWDFDGDDISDDSIDDDALDFGSGTDQINSDDIPEGSSNLYEQDSGTNTGDEPDATPSVKGIVELADDTEALAGTDTGKAVTPAGVKIYVDANGGSDYSFATAGDYPAASDKMVAPDAMKTYNDALYATPSDITSAINGMPTLDLATYLEDNYSYVKNPTNDIWYTTYAFGTIADCSTGINAAIASLSIGETLNAESGIYYCDDYIDMDVDGITFQGDGQDLTIFRVADESDLTRLLNVSADRCVFKDMTFDGDVENNQAHNIYGGIVEYQSDYTTFNNVGFINTSYSGLYCGSPTVETYGLQVKDCSFYDNGYNSLYFLSQTDANISHCNFDKCGGTSLMLYNPTQITVEKNYITKATAPTVVAGGGAEGGWLLGLYAKCTNVTVKDNILYDNITAVHDGLGIVAEGEISSKVIISGNTIENAGGYGLDLVSGCTAVNNTIINSASVPVVFLNDEGGYMANAIISNNKIINGNMGTGASITAIAIGSSVAEGTYYATDDWTATTAYSVGDWVAPATPNGYLLSCSTAGTSSASEPTFSLGQKTDGTVTWQGHALFENITIEGNSYAWDRTLPPTDATVFGVYVNNTYGAFSDLFINNNDFGSLTPVKISGTKSIHSPRGNQLSIPITAITGYEYPLTFPVETLTGPIYDKSGIDIKRVMYRVVTTNATPIPAGIFPVLEKEAYYYNFDIIAHNSTGTVSAAYNLKFVAHRLVLSSATVVGSLILTVVGETNSSMTVTVAVATDYLYPVITGTSTATIYWDIFGTVMKAVD